MKKKNETPLEEAVRLAMAHGMTYAEFQQMESLGLVKIKDGRMIFLKSSRNRRGLHENH